MSEIKLRSQATSLRVIEIFSRIVAYLVSIALLIGAVFITADAFVNLFRFNINQAIQDALSVLILLEMFYVIRSYIKHGSINVGLVINVGVIAIIKELILQLSSITLQVATGFALLLITLAAVYYVEFLVFQKYKEEKKQKYIERQS